MSHSHNHGGGTSEMGGMDMSMGLFIQDNQRISHIFWYLVLAATATRGVRTLIDYVRTRLALRKHSARSAVPSRPTNVLSQAYDTTLSIFRESSYPAPRPFTGRISQFLTPPPLGQSLLILTYVVIILIMLFTNVWLTPTSPLYGYKWEKPAFRAAWVSVSQLPLVYALSCKFNVISLLTGISYERLNWMHRWVSRILFLTLIVHWAYFMHEWVLAGFVEMQLELMPMVKYGFGAWAVIGWSVLTGFGLFRDVCHELWLLQHLGTAGLLLWLVYKHVPSYATYNVWMCIGFVAFDRITRAIWSAVNNLHLRSFGKGKFGYQAQITPLEDGYLRLSIENVNFAWRAGQHVFVCVPSCGIFESHPFTISNNFEGNKSHGQNLDLFLKCHAGFTKRLRKRALKLQDLDHGSISHRTFLSGPWGIPPLPTIERSNALVFIASSTGASFTVPLLEHATKKAPFVHRVRFYWIVRHTSQTAWFQDRIKAALASLSDSGVVETRCEVFVTGSASEASGKCLVSPLDMSSNYNSESEASGVEKQCVESTVNVTHSSQPMASSKAANSKEESNETDASSESAGVDLSFSVGRPKSLDDLIRPVVESAHGETTVVACGGKSLIADIRSYVGALSDERAVHKGTGAQSISLFTESYGY